MSVRPYDARTLKMVRQLLSDQLEEWTLRCNYFRKDVGNNGVFYADGLGDAAVDVVNKIVEGVLAEELDRAKRAAKRKAKR